MFDNPIDLYAHLRRRGFILVPDNGGVSTTAEPVTTIDNATVPPTVRLETPSLTVDEAQAIAANVDALAQLARDDLSAGFDAHAAMPNLTEAIWADEEREHDDEDGSKP